MIVMRIFLLFLCIFLLTACDHENKKNKVQKTRVIVATLKTPVKKLYFTGTLLPITTNSVISPVGGNISAIHFAYGERVQDGQVLLVIDSRELSKTYREAVSDYLKKKQAYITGKTTFAGTKALYQAGVISQNDFISAKTTYDNTALDYLQSQFALEKVLKTANIDFQKIETLSLSDTEKVNAVLETHFRHIQIPATGTGVALFPQPKRNSGGDTSGKLAVGDTVKENDLLLSIGNLTGLSASFNVSEIDIDRIHRKMPVIITGSAFPGAQLHGVVTAVSVQADQDSGGEGGLSMFSVKINIPRVDEEIMEKIRVGMTAKFEIDIPGVPHIMLPVNAVTRSNGNDTVTLLVAPGKEKTVPVIVGETSPTDIVIINGVQVGDKVVVSDQSNQ